MTSIPQPAYPADYYPPRYIDSRADDPYIPPSTQRLLSRSVTASSNLEQLIKQPTKPTEKIATNVATDQGLPDVNVTQSVKTHQEKGFGRDPVGRNIPKLVVQDNLRNPPLHPPTYSALNHDNKYIESNKMPNNYINQSLPNKTKLKPIPTEVIQKPQEQQQPGTIGEEPQTTGGYWKTGTLFNSKGVVAIGPIIYEENSYIGPFGFDETGSYIFYIGMVVFIFLAGIFLIMSGVFYSQTTDSSKNIGNLAGVGICAFALYLGIQILLIGLWNQKYRQEKPEKKIPNKKPRLVYTPFGYYLYPQYFADLNEQLHMQQTGPPNTEKPVKIVQPTKPVEVKPLKPEVRTVEKTVDVPEPPRIEQKPEFYSIQLVPDTIDQVPSTEPKTKGKTESVEAAVGTKKPVDKSATDSKISSRRNKRMKPVDEKTIVPSSNNRLRQIPVANRTLTTLEPYSAPANSQVVIRPQGGTFGYVGVIGDLSIEDINDNDPRLKIKKNRTSTERPISNAFYD